MVDGRREARLDGRMSDEHEFRVGWFTNRFLISELMLRLRQLAISEDSASTATRTSRVCQRRYFSLSETRTQVTPSNHNPDNQVLI